MVVRIGCRSIAPYSTRADPRSTIRSEDIVLSKIRGYPIARCAVSILLAALAITTSARSFAETAAGTTLIHYGQVDNGVYKGSKPGTDADYRFLQARHIKYILDLELLPSMRDSEQKRAKRYGIVVLHNRINASPVAPSEKHIDAILAVLRDKRYHPIYFHCAYGRDRTSLIAALYKMYFLGMSEQAALRYMDESGYKNSWVRGGLKRYLKNHPAPTRTFKTAG